MNNDELKRFTIDIPSSLKTRLEIYAIQQNTTMKETIIQILDNNLPKYEIRTKKETKQDPQ